MITLVKSAIGLVRSVIALVKLVIGHQESVISLVRSVITLVKSVIGHQESVKLDYSLIQGWRKPLADLAGFQCADSLVDQAHSVGGNLLTGECPEPVLD